MKKELLLQLADDIEPLHHRRRGPWSRFVPSKNSPSDKQFTLEVWYFECGMPACAGGRAQTLFPNLFPLGKCNDTDDFAYAFSITAQQAKRICLSSYYKSENPRPKTVARRIREIVESDNT